MKYGVVVRIKYLSLFDWRQRVIFLYLMISIVSQKRLIFIYPNFSRILIQIY